MKRQLSIVALAIAALTATAQETYQDATLLRPELNGTARYVGMGGAMEALGADISTMGTNPAGIGLFRHSTASLSFGIISQQDAAKMEGADKTHASFAIRLSSRREDAQGAEMAPRVSPEDEDEL